MVRFFSLRSRARTSLTSDSPIAKTTMPLIFKEIDRTRDWRVTSGMETLYGTGRARKFNSRLQFTTNNYRCGRPSHKHPWSKRKRVRIGLRESAPGPGGPWSFHNHGRQTRNLLRLTHGHCGPGCPDPAASGTNRRRCCT